jgi:ATP-binding cassette, subfamily F, member 3
LGKLLVQRSNLLLLDEPTNHLDMYSCEALIQAAKDFPGAIMIVTHNEEILYELATRLIVFDRNETFLFEGTYRDFLERVGWQEEDDLGKNRSEERVSANKKESRRKRADIISRRSKECNPLKIWLEKIEIEIVEIEAQIKEQSEQLTEISKDGFGDDAAKLSRTLCKNKERMEVLFQELESLTKEYDTRWADYEQELELVSKI